ncbi:nitrate reductase [Sedimenticola sp.]|uniref:nitrate reductase n=1 Tax=Sedimenticola sp. TaxID=1940285 RepID=UPI00258F1D0E|nr:nitrate reductase [Sedimenticola sp.]MCW8903014.1 nitrate reductase [Sedimenticola sp.]
MSLEVRTTCPYCGVGCGVIARREPSGAVTITGDPEHPSNYGRLCSKGSALGETLGESGRLLTPMVNGREVGWDTALDSVANGLQQAIREHGPESVAFYVSGQLLTEDYYVANKLMKGFIGAANIDTNSRLCMSSAVAAHKRAFGADVMPCSYDDLERAKLIVLAGSNAAWCHPVIYQRIMASKQQNPDLQIVTIDPRMTPTAATADLHLAIRPGTDALLFNGLLVYLEQQGERNSLFVRQATRESEAALAVAALDAPDIARVAKGCGLAPAAVERFYRLFARTERVVTVYSQGINQSSSGVDKINAIINCHLLTGRIGRPGMGPFSLTGQPNAMGGREVGGLANQLAAHMELESEADRERVKRFWEAPAIPRRGGLKAVDLFDAVEAGRIRVLWIMATNPAVSLPDSDRIRRALEKCALVIVSDCVAATDTLGLAHIRLPATTWGERDGTVTSSERRISRQHAFLHAPGEARPDWWIVSQVASRMGYARQFNYQRPSEIFREHAALSGFENRGGHRAFDISGYADLSDAAYEALTPRQWPLTRREPSGTCRLFSEGLFCTEDGRARFVPVTPRPPKNMPNQEYPLTLNSGRVRDHWHTMTRTGLSPRLASHTIEPYAEVHPDDAALYDLADGTLACIESPTGSATVRVRVTAGQQPGSLFMPMHWNGQFAETGRVNALLPGVTDPLSGQPEFKQGRARIRERRYAWHGFLFSRRRLQPVGADYWARSRGAGCWRYEMAGDLTPQDWAGMARSYLCSAEQEVGWMEYSDRAANRYRAARFVDNSLESCLFIGPDLELPPRDWIEVLFGKASLDMAERASLLSGHAPDKRADVGRIVCACHGVGEKRIQAGIQVQGLNSVEAIAEVLKAGSGCGSCVPEIRALLAAG